MSLQYIQPYFGLGNSLQTAQGGSAAGIGGWVELARTTLGSAAATMTVSSLDDKRYYMVLCDKVSSGTTSSIGSRLNGDTGTNYAFRTSSNGSEGSEINMPKITGYASGTGNIQHFNIDYLSNLSAQEKLLQGHSVWSAGSGATDAPERHELVAKHAQTSNPITSYNMSGSGNWAIGSEIVVLGWDPADTHTTNFWEELASVNLSGGVNANLSSGTISAKKYLWVQFWLDTTTGTPDVQISFNNDTSTNYTRRRSINGGADATATSQDDINPDGSVGDPLFVNMFIINNSANEKLVIGNSVRQSTAGSGNAPDRREWVAKWANTSAQITEIDLDVNSSTMTTGSIMKVWGSD